VEVLQPRETEQHAMAILTKTNANLPCQGLTKPELSTQCAWSRVRTKSDRKAHRPHEIRTWICHWCPALRRATTRTSELACNKHHESCFQLATGHEHNGWIPYGAKCGAGFSWSSLAASYSSPTLFRSWRQTSTPLLSNTIS